MKALLIILVLTTMTSCKMYDWHYQYSGQEKRKVTPKMNEALEIEKQNGKEDETK